ncbi:MAG: gamma-glutamyltransferase [Pyrinomonadaceae bacterium]
MTNQIRRVFAAVFLISLTLVLSPSFSTITAAWPEPVRGKNGMVASQHELASQIGVDILKKGGNAVDAAVAVGLALAVVYPEAGNIGGGGFMVFRDKRGEFHAIDYREMAPGAASRDMFVDAKGNLIEGEGSSTVGYRASGVPGTLAGFELAFKKYGSGKVTWRQLVEPARLLALNGYALSNRLAELFIEYKDTLERYPESKRIFLRDGNYFKEGDTLRQPELAATLGRVARLGARDFYAGETAKLIAADMIANGGLITEQDLKNYVAKERQPLHGNYRGHEIVSMPPPSSGGMVMFETLNILEGYDLRALGSNTAAKYHLYIEASRRAFADRSEYMADPDFAEVPVGKLIEKGYAKERRGTIVSNKATPSRDVKFGNVAGKDPMETTHYTVVDKDGMVVSNTYTINDLYGSRVTIKGTGILMNDEMDDLAARPGRPNLFGLVQGERNKVEPKKRPLSSMTPTIVMRKDGSTWFALGARGGPRIISAVMQSIINVIDYDMNILEAISAPRMHHQWLPDSIMWEANGISPDTMAIMRGYGHVFNETSNNVASATGIMIDEKGVRLGAIDPRSDGKAVGY